MSEDECVTNCGTPIPDGGTWGYCENCWNYVCVSSTSEKQVTTGVPLEQQLELALRLLGDSPRDKELWHTNLELIDAKLKIADLQKELEKERRNK